MLSIFRRIRDRFAGRRVPLEAQEATIRLDVAAAGGMTGVLIRIETPKYSSVILLPTEDAMALARKLSDTARMAMETIAPEYDS